MTELKAINAYRMTTNTEDSDVYIHNNEFGCGGDLVECYLRPEADKVIARHQYLRCLVIAQWCSCKSKVYDLYARHTDYIPNVQKYRRKRDHYADRFKKLLVLAEKFKEDRNESQV